MNNRDYKQFLPGYYYHVYNRGTGKMDIFLDKEDYLFFLHRLREAILPSSVPRRKYYRAVILPEGSFDLICQCLMPNHFHLLIKQNGDIPISKLLSKVSTSYSKYFNKKYGRVGSIFQDQFKAVCVETNEQLLWLSVYIHKNPLVAKLVNDLERYEYSSYLNYIGKREDNLYKKDIICGQIGQGKAYKKSVLSDFELSSEITLDSSDYDYNGAHRWAPL